MADRMRMTSLMGLKIPLTCRGSKDVDAQESRSRPMRVAIRLARVGRIALRAQTEVPSALRPDTPKPIQLLALHTSVSSTAVCPTGARLSGILPGRVKAAR
jgi:hypothetical protein